MQLQFRRNTNKTATFSKKILILIVALLIIAALFYFLAKMTKTIPTTTSKIYTLPIRFLSKDSFLIHTDTTNYQKFASTLLKYTNQFVDNPNSLQIIFYIPPNINVADIQELYLVTQSTNFKTLLKKSTN